MVLKYLVAEICGNIFDTTGRIVGAFPVQQASIFLVLKQVLKLVVLKYYNTDNTGRHGRRDVSA